MFQLDIDRLHKVFHGELTGRGCGITTAICYQAIGFAQVESKKIFIIYEGNHNLYDYIIRQLRMILDYERITYTQVENKFQFIFESIAKNGPQLWYQNYISSEIIICSIGTYEWKYQRGRKSEEDIILYDFIEGYYQGFNSAQLTWDDIVRAEEILWSRNSGMKVTHTKF